MIKQSTFDDSRTHYKITEEFISKTDEDLYKQINERLLIVLKKKLAKTGDNLDYDRHI